MKKLLLFVLFIHFTHIGLGQAGPCNPILVGTSTTVISTTMLMDSSASVNSEHNLLICSGNTLTYNWVLAKDFYVKSGATLVLKSAQIAKIHLETGATLIFDTVGQVFNGTVINGISYDSTNVTLVDTNQFVTGSGSTNWLNCLNNTFNYTSFGTINPCFPLSVDNSLKDVLKVTFTNPVNDNIRFDSLIVEDISSLKIFDISGKIIRIIGKPNKQTDVSFLPKGIYLLQVNGKEGETVVKKFFKS